MDAVGAGTLFTVPDPVAVVPAPYENWPPLGRIKDGMIQKNDFIG
jgi:hypothetical protein